MSSARKCLYASARSWWCFSNVCASHPRLKAGLTLTPFSRPHTCPLHTSHILTHPRTSHVLGRLTCASLFPVAVTLFARRASGAAASPRALVATSGPASTSMTVGVSRGYRLSMLHGALTGWPAVTQCIDCGVWCVDRSACSGPMWTHTLV